MVITLTTEKLVNIMRAISNREVAVIADPDARYRAEAGSDKMGDIQSCINDAVNRLYGRCARFMVDTYTMEKDNSLSFPTSYSFDLSLSERRAVNKAEPLEEAMNTFVVEYALSKFYSIVSQSELSNKHSLYALDAGTTIEQLLYAKHPPFAS